MTLEWVAIGLMAVSFVVFVGEPLFRRSSIQRVGGSAKPELEQLSLQKETLYTAIRDLDFDFQTSKVDEADYRDLRHQLEGEALQVLRALDAVDPLMMLDAEIERQILSLRQSSSPRAHLSSQGVCIACQATLQGGENFCPFCSQPLSPT